LEYGDGRYLLIRMILMRLLIIQAQHDNNREKMAQAQLAILVKKVG